MKKQLLLTAVVAMMGFTNPLSAAEDDVVITVDTDNGSLAPNGTGRWNKTWTSTRTNPGLQLSASANNISNSSTNLDIRSGSSGTNTFTLSSTDAGYYISAYSFKATHTGSGSVSITTNGTTTALSSTAQLFERNIEESESGQPVTFTETGTNSQVVFTEFTVTLSRHTPQYYFTSRIEAALTAFATDMPASVRQAISNIEVPDYSTISPDNASTEIATYVNGKLDDIMSAALADENLPPVRFTHFGKLPSVEYMTYTPGEENKLNRSTTAGNANVWKLIRQEDGTFRIKLSSDNVWLATIAANNGIMQVVTDEAEAGRYQITIADHNSGSFFIKGYDTDRYVHSNNGTAVVAYNGNGGNSQWKISTLTPTERLTELLAQARTNASVSEQSGLWTQEEVTGLNSKVSESITGIEVDWDTVTDVEAKLTEIESNLNTTISSITGEAYALLHDRRYKFHSAKANYTDRYMLADADCILSAGSETDSPLNAIWQLQFTEESGDCRTVRLYNPVRRQYLNGTANRVSLTDDKELETTVFSIEFNSESNKVGFFSQPRNNYVNLNGSGHNSFTWWGFDAGSSFTASLVNEDYTAQITDEMLTNLSEIGNHHKASVLEQEPGDYLTADVTTMLAAYAGYAAETNNNDAICIRFFYDTAEANRAWPCFQLVYYGDKTTGLEAGSRSLASLGHGSYSCHGATDKFDLRQAWIADGSTSAEVRVDVRYDFKNLETGKRIFHTNASYEGWRYNMVAYNDGTGTYKITNGGNAALAIINAESSASSPGTNLSSQYYNNNNSKWKFVYLGTDKALKTMISKSETWRSDDKAEVRVQFAHADTLAHPVDKVIGTRLGQYNCEGYDDAVAEYERLGSSIIEFDFDDFATVYTTLSENTPVLNLPADGTYLRAESAKGSTWNNRNNEGAKLHYSTTTHNNRICLTKDAVTDGSDLFLYKDGHLTAVCNGMNLHIVNTFPNFPASAADNADAATSATGTITFLEGNNQPGTYQMSATNSSNQQQRHFHVNSTSDTNVYIDCCGSAGNTHGASDLSHNWTLTQVDTLTVNVIGDSDFGSFYCVTAMTPVAVEGTIYYYGTNSLQEGSEEHRELVFTRIEPGTVVPEGYVVVFEAANGYGKLRKPVAGETPIEADADQAFQGSHLARVHTATEGTVTFAHMPAPTAAPEPAAAPRRVTAIAEDGEAHVADMMVYPVNDGDALPANAMTVTLPENSKLISSDGTSATFSVGDQVKNPITTGLDRIVFDNGDGSCVIYDLQGRKLNTPVRGRVNIINGRKVYVR